MPRSRWAAAPRSRAGARARSCARGSRSRRGRRRRSGWRGRWARSALGDAPTPESEGEYACYSGGPFFCVCSWHARHLACATSSSAHVTAVAPALRGVPVVLRRCPQPGDGGLLPLPRPADQPRVPRHLLRGVRADPAPGRTGDGLRGRNPRGAARPPQAHRHDRRRHRHDRGAARWRGGPPRRTGPRHAVLARARLVRPVALHLRPGLHPSRAPVLPPPGRRSSARAGAPTRPTSS